MYNFFGPSYRRMCNVTKRNTTPLHVSICRHTPREHSAGSLLIHTRLEEQETVVEPTVWSGPERRNIHNMYTLPRRCNFERPKGSYRWKGAKRLMKSVVTELNPRFLFFLRKFFVVLIKLLYCFLLSLRHSLCKREVQIKTKKHFWSDFPLHSTLP